MLISPTALNIANFVKHILKHYSISKDQAPCMNCLLIEMGEMACYQERCPQCGRVPPGRKAASGKKPKPPAVFKKLVGRKLSGKKTVRTNGIKSETMTNQNGKSYLTAQSGHNGGNYFQQQPVVSGRWQQQQQQDSMV